ncbi:MAG: NAD(P)H-binding protein [Actinobacteria bacterium]|nr:NAD(P)H-binding protein [Actinomycetota bacterium]
MSSASTTDRAAAVTGAFGFTGKYIARHLLAEGCRVVTLTNHPDRADPFDGRVEARPLDFADPTGLVRSLEGVDTLYNTYWIRFEHGLSTFARAVEHTRTLIGAAQEAGVRRLVHVSITNPDPASPLPYFSGKAAVEQAIRDSRLSWAILRPAVVFGQEDILINNIAWLVRRFPVFAVPGAGEYRLQPIHADDLATLAVRVGRNTDNVTIDATGPETYTFKDLVKEIGHAVGRSPRIVSIPSGAMWALGWVLGRTVGDVTLTRDEITGLSASLLATESPPAGTTSLRRWLRENADTVGRHYASEIARHYR